MERSGHDDGWGEPWDGGDDDLSASAYPPAPLPAHERPWRHPSEIGQSNWQNTEPPVAIGRGLLVTTGAVGCILGIAVLLLLVPIGGGLAPTASPSATSSFAVETTEIPDSTPRTALLGTTVSSTTGSSTTVGAALLPGEQVPSTVLVRADSVSTTGGTVTVMAIAVSVTDQPFMITTAHAVLASRGVSIIGPGESASGTVVSVGRELAFIEPGWAIEVASFSAVATAEPGDMVTVLTDTPTEAVYAPDGGVPELDASSVLEGTPVVDADGALVALCTLIVDGDGAYVDMVPITFPDVATTTTETSDPTSDTVPATSTASPSTTTTTVTATTAAATITTGGGTVPTAPATPVMVAWAGLRFDGAPTSALLTVTGVAPMSPAATAGIVAGDRITAVGGRSVDTVDALLAEIRRHAPGDVVLLAVLSRPAVTAAANPTAVEHTVSVTLGAVAPIG